MKISDLHQFLLSNDNFILTTHENPDGDGLGSMIALGHYLRSLGKKVRLVVTPSLGNAHSWIGQDNAVEVYRPEVHAEVFNGAKCWIVIDASDPKRLGALYPIFQSSQAIKACIDHHLKEAPQGFDQEFTDPQASASAQLVFRLLQQEYHGSWELIAPALYTGIVADTGNFRFSNATPEVHEMAAFLIQEGAQPPQTYQALYHQDSLPKVKLWARLLQSMQLLDQDRLAIIEVRPEDFKITNSCYEDLDELVQQPMRIPSVEVSALLTDLGDGWTKISLRSRERIDVHAICQSFNGGGHRLASGAKIKKPLDEIRRDITSDIATQLNYH
ncbi:MAG: DHH family phosphoesterase [Holophagaceae bacterium]